MKKQLLFILSLLLMSSMMFSQSDAEKTLLDKMSKDACKQIEKAGIKEKDDISEIESKLGLALLPVIMDNKAEIKKVWKLDVSVPDDAKQVGEKLGEHLVFACPKFQEITMQLMRTDSNLAKSVNDKLNEKDTAVPTELPPAPDESITGKISKIEGTDVYYIYVNTEDGETIKLLWLEDFNGSDLLADGTFANKKFAMTYVKKSIYQPQTKSYKDVKVITGLAKA